MIFTTRLTDSELEPRRCSVGGDGAPNRMDLELDLFLDSGLLIERFSAGRPLEDERPYPTAADRRDVLAGDEMDRFKGCWHSMLTIDRQSMCHTGRSGDSISDKRALKERSIRD